MKVDASGYTPTVDAAGGAAAKAEARRIRRLVGGRDADRPVPRLRRSPPSAPSGSRSAPAIAVAFARNPMTRRAAGQRPPGAVAAGASCSGLGSQIKPHITRRYSMPWSQPAPRMREFVLAMRAIWDAWETGEQLDFRGDFYTHTLMTPFFNPGPNPHGNPKIVLAAVGPLMTEVGGRGRRRLPRATGSRPSATCARSTIPALERGCAKAGRTARRLRDQRAGVRRHRRHRGGDRGRRRRRQAADRLLRLDPRLPPGARPPRLGGPPGRAQRADEARRVGQMAS